MKYRKDTDARPDTELELCWNCNHLIIKPIDEYTFGYTDVQDYKGNWETIQVYYCADCMIRPH